MTTHLRPDGYSNVRFGGVQVLGHRLAYALHYGEDPTGKVVMHLCDNPPCVNPLHLRLGSQADNMTDMVSKGRQNKARHLAHARARLNYEKVAYIRSNPDKLSWSALGCIFGVAKSSIQSVVERKSWV
jgi:hypothetical protein